MAEEIRTFWVERLSRLHWTYRCEQPGPCPARAGGEHYAEFQADLLESESIRPDFYPKACACGQPFSGRSQRASGRPWWRITGTGEEFWERRPGMMWVEEPWLDEDGWSSAGADGLSIAVVLPNGSCWWPESRASNCTRKDDITHRCWVRHGTVGGIIHVDKAGNTCNAGAGSIDSNAGMPDHWHGFLHNGVLRRC